jgi:hypothetical protein
MKNEEWEEEQNLEMGHSTKGGRRVKLVLYKVR